MVIFFLSFCPYELPALGWLPSLALESMGSMKAGTWLSCPVLDTQGFEQCMGKVGSSMLSKAE